MQITVPDPPTHGSQGWDVWLEGAINILTDFAHSTQTGRDLHEGLTTGAHGGLVAATDARLTDARTPLAHAASHAAGAADAITPAAIGAVLETVYDEFMTSFNDRVAEALSSLVLP